VPGALAIGGKRTTNERLVGESYGGAAATNPLTLRLNRNIVATFSNIDGRLLTSLLDCVLAKHSLEIEQPSAAQSVRLAVRTRHRQILPQSKGGHSEEPFKMIRNTNECGLVLLSSFSVSLWLTFVFQSAMPETSCRSELAI